MKVELGFNHFKLLTVILLTIVAMGHIVNAIVLILYPR